MESEEKWIDVKNSGIRILFLGVFSVVIAFIIYSRFTNPSQTSPMLLSNLTNIGVTVFLVTIASMTISLIGILKIIKSSQLRGKDDSSLISIISSSFANRRMRLIMLLGSIGYFVLFGFLSQIFVYAPTDSFSNKGIPIPSTSFVLCCGPPGYVPMFTAYITDNFLIFLIPLNIILAITVSALVGFNISFNLYALSLRRAFGKSKASFLTNVGLAGGLFVGCPTCAGTFFSATLGISAGTSLAALAPFQTLFIAISIPALLFSPLLIARSIRSISRCNTVQ